MNENGVQGPDFGIGGVLTLAKRLLTAAGIAMMANVLLPVSALSAEKENEAAATQLKNGSFETIVNYGKGKRKEWEIKDGKGPLNWSLMTKTGSLEVCTYPDGKSHYVKLSGGAIYQFYTGQEAIFQPPVQTFRKGGCNRAAAAPETSPRRQAHRIADPAAEKDRSRFRGMAGIYNTLQARNTR